MFLIFGWKNALNVTMMIMMMTTTMMMRMMWCCAPTIATVDCRHLRLQSRFDCCTTVKCASAWVCMLYAHRNRFTCCVTVVTIIHVWLLYIWCITVTAAAASAVLFVVVVRFIFLAVFCVFIFSLPHFFLYLFQIVKRGMENEHNVLH